MVAIVLFLCTFIQLWIQTVFTYLHSYFKHDLFAERKKTKEKNKRKKNILMVNSVKSEKCCSKNLIL